MENTTSKNHSFKKAVIILLAMSLLAGCSALTGKGKSSNRSSNGVDGAYGEEEYGMGAGLTEQSLDPEYESRFGDGSIPMAEEEGEFRDVYFDYDSSGLSPEAKQDIQENASLLKQNPSLSIQLEGHCDERGTDEYNLALGEFRARSVRDGLVANGVNPSRINTISYGEHMPLDGAGSDLAFAKNRRVHFAVTSGR